MKTINFEKGAWNPEEFRYVYSLRFTPIPRMKQEEDCIVNGIDSDTGEFDYVSMVLEKKYKTGVKVEISCSFESYGAPIIVLSDDLHKQENGEWYFGIHYEIVLWEKGINVWKLNLNPGIMDWKKLLALSFPVSAKEKHTLQVRVLENALEIIAGGQKVMLRVEELPAEFYIGLTACEGINRFYSYCIDE